MQNSDFTKLAETTLQEICGAIEEADSDYALEVDLLDGILSIELPDNSKYILNKHDASQQIWLSSPVSGASHFSYNPDTARWKDSKDCDLLTILYGELKKFGQIIP